MELTPDTINQPIQPQTHIQGKNPIPPVIFIVSLLTVFAVGAGGMYLWLKYPEKRPIDLPPQEKGCTLDAKICPDGSAVGRIPPTCEFAPCPSPGSSIKPTLTPVSSSQGESVPGGAPVSKSSLVPADWKTYKDEKTGIEFRYPKDWYVKSWPLETFNIFLEDHPFEIPEQTEFMSLIQIRFNEGTDTESNQKFFLEKTLDEGVKRVVAGYDQKSVKTDSLTVGGKKAVQISGVWGPGMLEGQYFVETLVQMNGKLLDISLSNKQYEKIYAQILSTFKFSDN